MNNKFKVSLLSLIASGGIFLFSACRENLPQPEEIPKQVYTQRKDTYPNFEALKAKEIEGTDYIISVFDRRTKNTILAIHGGNIDEWTSEIAKSVAREDINLYLFEGLKPAEQAIRLHLTSHRFNEPQALALVSHSKKCIAIHGFRSEDNVLCLGGNDEKLLTAMSEHLKNKNFDFKIQSLCKAIEGTHRKNIVNQCEDAGVQLEFSTVLRKKLMDDADLLKKVSDAIREALFSETKASSL